MRPSIDESVLALAAAGSLTSATLLVTGDTSRLPALIGRIRDQGAPAVGLHLDLDAWFRFDETGHYGDTETDIIDDYAAIVRARRDELRREVVRQLAIIRALGLEPTHLDGHHNVHLFPPLRDLVLPLARESGITKARLDTGFYRTAEAIEAARDAFRSEGILHTDTFLDLGHLLDEGLGALEWLEGSIEIMAHTELPGPGADPWRTAHHAFLERATLPGNASPASYGTLRSPSNA